jgi:GWxTD domain-containing protein
VKGQTVGTSQKTIRPRHSRRWLRPAHCSLLTAHFFLLTSHCLLLTAALAQSPSERVALDAFRDSLLPIRDTTQLRRLAQALRRQAEHQSQPALLRLRAGLAFQRRSDLGVQPGYGDAIAQFRAATRQAPEWPYAWHSLGLAEERRAQWERSNRLELGSRVGVGSMERALDDYRQALAADPGFTPAAVHLEAVTSALRDTALVGPARDAVRRAVASLRSAPPDLLLAWGRLERAAGDADSALAAFRRYLASGGRRALGLLEMARTQLAKAGPESDSAYYAGAAIEDSLTVAGYRTDLAPIASDSELTEFDRVHGDARVAFLHRFWSDRDQFELRRPGERIREHFRRLGYARQRFALTVTRRFYGVRDAYRSGSDELDDRGVIYVRHGEPAERLRPFVFGLMPNETWRYARADGDLLFHFSSGGDASSGGDLYDYRLVESVLDLHGASEAPIDQLLLSRQSLSPVYGRMLNWGRYGSAHSRSRERRIGQASIAVGVTSDSYELQFARRLAAVGNLIAVGRGAAGGLGQFVFAVGQAGTTPTSDSDGVSYPVRVRLAVMDLSQRTFASLDSTIAFHLARPLEPGQYLIGRVELPLVQGLWSWRAALQLGDSLGIMLPIDSTRAGRAGPPFSLSEIALGVREASTQWFPTPTDTVYLTPFDLFPEGRELELYYEGSGAVTGASYRHQIAVFRAKGEDPPVVERRPIVTLAFEEAAGSELVRARRSLQLARLKPGRYVVEVKVTGPDGRAESRRREFRIVKDRGS